MPSITVTVGSAEGLHARPAGIIAEAAEGFDTEVELAIAGEEPVDAGSAMMIMALGADQGVEVTVTGSDPAAVEAVAALVARDLDDE